MKKEKKSLLTKDFIKDTGVLFALVLLLMSIFWSKEILLVISIALSVMVLLLPDWVRPLGFIWLKITQILAKIIPTILLGIVFLLIIVPIGKIRKLFGTDTLKLDISKYKSSFNIRNHNYSKEDLIQQF